MPSQDTYIYGSDGQGNVSPELTLYQENSTNGYIAESGNFVQNSQYMTYLYTVPVDMELWVTYNGLCIVCIFHSATVSGSELAARYTSTQGNLPTENNKLFIPAGKTIGISVAKANGTAQYPLAFSLRLNTYSTQNLVNLDVAVFNTAASNGINLSITGGNTVSIAASMASNNGYGVVQTRNNTDPQITAASISVVPTQYYVQQEIARLEVEISGALRYEIISSYVEP